MILSTKENYENARETSGTYVLYDTIAGMFV